MENVIPTTEQILTAKASGNIRDAVIFGELHLLRILKEPCKEHEVPDDEFNAELLGVDSNGKYYLHRFNCPQCMAEIEKEIEE